MTSKNPVKVLLVEDDTDLRENMTEYLELTGYQVTGVADAKGFYTALGKETYKIAIIDIGLPDASGFILAKYLRATGSNLGIIILTANDAEVDQVKGYKAGADNYMVKPVSGPLLESAMQGLLLRLQHMPSAAEISPSACDVPCWHLSMNRWVLIAPCGAEIQLTALELKFLSILVEAKGETVNRHRFIELLYPRSDTYTGRALDAMVLRLRKKIIDTIPETDQPIRTVYGSGFCFSHRIFS
ncbi:MAG: response regulator transcription factor [Desulfuromonadaceae bacterium]|nr:response regulator transcription factor [Desulfuromonas sp.]MDY0185576.1 response regulator transcription factor [Desulfuromonadaceae bacterium]